MNKVEILREYMKKCGVSACIIPTADPHLSEYVPEHYKLREWVSGFTGSAGTLVVTEEEGGLWTDGRYYIQAEKELSGSGIKLYKASEPDCTKIHEYLAEKLNCGDILGVDGSLFSKKELDNIIEKLRKCDININTEFTPDVIWENRPSMPSDKAFILPEKYCGEKVSEKVEKVRSLMKKEEFTHYLAALPESIMWLLNIRGNDIKSTPVMLSYLVVSQGEIFLYAPKEKIDDCVCKYLENNNVTLNDYKNIISDLRKIGEDSFIAADFTLCNYNLIKALKCAYKDRKDFIYNLKCIRTKKEIENIKKAYIKENIALTKSFYEIYHSENIDECDVCDIIEKNRRAQEGYIYPSFDTIAAFGANAAMMHYSCEKESCAKIEKNGLLLIDTGGQYFEGTTDTTRTLVLGEISDEQKENLTLVLKGNIALLMAVFPDGALGRDIDILARMPLWEKGLDYRCSTGHGVGYLLGVHEGPQRLSIKSQEKLCEMMTITDEPGVYVENEYGIRIENHLCVKKYMKTEYGSFLCFEVLNYCPIGTRGIIPQMLDERQRKWLNDYNEKCSILLKPFLTKEEYEWLKTYIMKI